MSCKALCYKVFSLVAVIEIDPPYGWIFFFFGRQKGCARPFFGRAGDRANKCLGAMQALRLCLLLGIYIKCRARQSFRWVSTTSPMVAQELKAVERTCSLSSRFNCSTFSGGSEGFWRMQSKRCVMRVCSAR